MKGRILLLLTLVLLMPGCISHQSAGKAPGAEAEQAAVAPVLQKQFLLDVVQYVYRWHFDRSFLLEPDKYESLEIWARPIKPKLDADDHSEFAELWIPAILTKVELKRSDYRVAELNLAIVDRSFKVKRVSRQLRPSASKSQFVITRLPRAEVAEYLFNTRAQSPAIGENLRLAGRRLVANYLARAHPEPFAEKQIYYFAPPSPVCNDIWVFWETGRKALLFSADMDLSNPGSEELSQLRLTVIDLDKDVVTSTSEVPGSNAFVTKDWVGRLFFNCILYGNRLERTPEEMNEFLKLPARQ